jgi:hedgehog protein
MLLLLVGCVTSCGPGRGSGARRGARKMTPLVFKQHVPNVSERTLGASGLAEGRISRSDRRFRDLVVNGNPEIMFKDEEGTGADRIMSRRCRDKLNVLAISVMNQWPGVRLRVTEAWDEDGLHSADSLHYEGRAVDVTTSDRDRTKYGMLARLAVEAGFDWVYFESRGHIHCSVKSDSSIAIRNGGCFPASASVQLETGSIAKMADLAVGDRVLTVDAETGEFRYDDVITFLHRDPTPMAPFVVIATDDGHRLTVTPDHLVYAGNRNMTSSPSLSDDVMLFAGDFRSDGVDLVYVTGSDSDDSSGQRHRRSVVVTTVTDVSISMKRGVYAPLTNAGNIVVDGVVASCYASFGSQSAAHASMAPLRLAAHARRLWSSWWFGRGWPSGGDRRPETDVVGTGVHWFAESLRHLAEFVLPSSLWYKNVGV